jgi:hypothetical protein
MAHFAELDANNIVIRVMVMDDSANSNTCQTVFNSSNTWIQTSYNTWAGVHTANGTPLRKNYASAGFTYDPSKDAFIPPRPFPSWNSWVLNEDTCQWEPPVPMPDPLPPGTMNKSRSWNESANSWLIIDTPTAQDIGRGNTAIFDIENCKWIIEKIK